MAEKKDYESFVASLMEKYSGKEKEFVGFLLGSDEVKDSYESLISGNVPGESINEIFMNSVKSAQKGKKSSPDRFVDLLSRNLAKSGNHQVVLDDFFNKGLIAKKHENPKEDIVVTKNVVSIGSKHGKIIMFACVAIAVFFFLKSLISGNFISAVIGGGVADYDVIYGTAFLLFGLALAHFTYRKEIVNE